MLIYRGKGKSMSNATQKLWTFGKALAILQHPPQKPENHLKSVKQAFDQQQGFVTNFATVFV